MLTKPTSEQVRERIGGHGGSRDRWVGTYVVSYLDGAPSRDPLLWSIRRLTGISRPASNTKIMYAFYAAFGSLRGVTDEGGDCRLAGVRRLARLGGGPV